MSTFYRYHALGNDYLVMDPRDFPLPPSPGQIRLICHRNFGVGSDGILYGPIFDGGDIRFRIFNPDGGEAEKSGNGIRIFARFLVDMGYVKSQRFSLTTLGGMVDVEILNDDNSLIQVDMGHLTFTSNEIPVAGEPREVVNEPITIDGETFRMTCVSVGNPHCVIPQPEISEELARRVGPKLETHPLFPNRINVQFLKVIDRKTIQIEIWERGAGYTMASGSSSSAAAGAAHRLGFVDEKITVKMPGGEIGIVIKPGNRILMTGPVTSVAKGEFMPEFRRLVEGQKDS